MARWISAELRQTIADRANVLCEYCLIAEAETFYGCEVDHIISLKHGGSSEPDNLAYACALCNRAKGSDVGSISTVGKFTRFFNPRSDRTEKLFPELARIALQAVQDACVKFAVSGVVEMNRAPRIYGEETAEWILRDLTATSRKEFLRIKPGRRAEVRKHLEETREAVGRLVTKGVLRIGDRPTQEQVAEEIGVELKNGAPGAIPTRDLPLRRRTLYATELREHGASIQQTVNGKQWSVECWIASARLSGCLLS